MIIESIYINYFCTRCGNSITISNFDVEFCIEDVHEQIGMAQCLNCQKVGSVCATHIKCTLSNKPLFKYQYTLRCNLCHATWVEKCIIGNKIGLMQIKRRIAGESECINPACASRSFSLISHKRVDS